MNTWGFYCLKVYTLQDEEVALPLLEFMVKIMRQRDILLVSLLLLFPLLSLFPLLILFVGIF